MNIFNENHYDLTVHVHNLRVNIWTTKNTEKVNKNWKIFHDGEINAENSLACVTH